MAAMALLGKVNRLLIVRDSDHGMYLDGGPLGEILLPTREVPADLEQGEELDVFVSRDSEDRIVATVTRPFAQVGEFAGLRVTATHERIGAFLDWGMAKELLLPWAEQPHRVAVGDIALVYIVIDPRSNRIIATGRTQRFLKKSRPKYAPGEAVTLLIQDRSPLGYNAIVDQQYRGLLLARELPRPIAIGETHPGFIQDVRPDGQLTLSLQASGYQRVGGLSEQILAALQETGGRLPLGDQSSPDEIRAVLGTSKKAFKQALGSLYRQRLIEIEPQSVRLL
jgi:hypothetical protein